MNADPLPYDLNSGRISVVDPKTLNFDPDQNFGPIWIRIQGNTFNFEEKKEILFSRKKKNFFKQLLKVGRNIFKKL